MSNQLYNIAREEFGRGIRSWTGQVMRFQLLGDAYVFDPSHVSMDDVPAGARILAPQTMTSMSMTDGYAVSAPVQYTNASDPTPVTQALIYYQDPSLIDANHRLVTYLDTISGLPLNLEGGDHFFVGAGPNSAWFRL